MAYIDESEWIMVRLRKGTHKRLREIGLMWQKEGEAGREVLYNPNGATLPLDSIVKELIRRDDDHRRRSRKSVVTQLTPNEAMGDS